MKSLLEKNFPNTKVYSSALMASGKIEVSWVKDGKKQIVWSAGKNATSSHEQHIVELMMKKA